MYKRLEKNLELEKAIAKRHLERTGNKNQIGSVEKILEELMPDILAEVLVENTIMCDWCDKNPSSHSLCETCLNQAQDN